MRWQSGLIPISSGRDRAYSLFNMCEIFLNKIYIKGEMAEWFNAHAWKVCVREIVPWVQIPLSPQ